jgi:hypothetical protein
MKKLKLTIGKITADDAGIVMSYIRFENVFIKHNKKWYDLHFAGTRNKGKKIYQKKYWR